MRSRRTAVLILVTALLAMATTLASVQGQTPQLPHSFWGDLTITVAGTEDPVAAPVGTEVTAVVDGEVRGSIEVREAGKYGNPQDPKLAVQAPTGEQIPEGAEILFFITVPGGAEVKADQSATFMSGEVTNLNLTASAEPTEQPTVAFASAGSSGAESVTTVNLEVRLSAASSQTVTVDYAVAGGSATRGVDYTLADGTLTFAPEDTSENIPITIVNDSGDEPNETILVTLSNPANADLGDPTTHTYTILDDDPGPTGPGPGNGGTPGFVLEVSKTGTGSGTVTSSPPGIDCGPDCSELFAIGRDITLTATPAPGSVFVRWSGDGFGTAAGTRVVNINQAKTFRVAAEFSRETVTVGRPTLLTLEVTPGISSGLINQEGVVQADAQLGGCEPLATLDVPVGTRALTIDGLPLTNLIIDCVTSLPPSPEDQTVIGFAYDLQPGGATFDPPVRLAIQYDPGQVQAGVAEEDLVVARYNSDAAQWEALEEVQVNAADNRVTAPVDHLTFFAVVSVGPPPAPTPTPEPTPAATPEPTGTPDPAPTEEPAPTPTETPVAEEPTPTLQPAATPPVDADGGLSAGALAGAIVGGIAVLAVIATIAVLVMQQRARA